MKFARLKDQDQNPVGVDPARVSSVYTYTPWGELDPHIDCKAVVCMLGGTAYWVCESANKAMDDIEEASAP